MNNIIRLEDWLRNWEITCNTCTLTLATKNKNKKYSIGGPFDNWKKFRPWMIQNSNNEMSDEEIKDFVTGAKASSILRVSRDIPLAIHSWNRYSRRAYVLTKELQFTLECMSLDDVMWRDILLPFPSFAISLDIPINGHYDLILVTQWKIEGVDHSRIYCLSQNISNLNDRTRPIVEKWSAAVNRRKWRNAKRQSATFERACTAQDLMMQTYMDFDPERIKDIPVTASANTIGRTSFGKKWETSSKFSSSVMSRVLQIVAGMCLYFKTLPVDSKHISPWKHENVRAKASSTVRAITDPTLVCSVASSFEFSPEERQIVDSILSESESSSNLPKIIRQLAPHFREGHWRRPPGKGHDPLHPKTVAVRPTFVHRELKPTKGLVGGLKKIVR